MRAASAQGGILYVEDFDVPAPEPAAPDIILPPLLPEDVAAAREAGRQEGMQAAAAEAEHLAGTLRAAALQTLADLLATDRATREKAARDAAEHVAEQILRLLAAVLPATAAAGARAELSALLAAVVPPLRAAPRAVLRLHPELVPALTEDLAKLTLEWHAPPQIVADPTLEPAALRLTWDDAEIRRDLTPIWDALRAALPRYPLPPTIPAEQPA